MNSKRFAIVGGGIVGLATAYRVGQRFPDARIIYRAPKTGDFTIICTTFGANSTGKYTLLVKEVPN